MIRASIPTRSFADVDLVHGPLEDEVPHVGDRGQLGPGLVRRERDDRDRRGSPSRVRIVPADGARMIESMSALAVTTAATPRQGAVLLGLVEGDLREFVRFAACVDVGLRHDPLPLQLLGPLEVDFGPVVGGLRGIHLRGLPRSARAASGSGAISKSESPAFTESPTSIRQLFTMPEIFDFTLNFWRGWIWPTATAFSVMEPVPASISFRPLAFFWERVKA